MLDCMNFLAGLGLFSEAELWQVGRDNPLAALAKTTAGIADLPPEARLRFENGRFCQGAV